MEGSKKLPDLRVVDLRAELEKRGLEKSGVKAVLIERLQKALEDEGLDPNEHVFEVSDATPTKKANTPVSGSGNKRSSARGKKDENGEEGDESMDEDDILDGPDQEKMEILDDDVLDAIQLDEEVKFDEEMAEAVPDETAVSESVKGETGPVSSNSVIKESPVKDQAAPTAETKMETDEVNGSAAGETAKNEAPKEKNEAAAENVSVPPTPESVQVEAPLTVEDTIKLSTSCDSKNDDNVSLVVHVDDPNDFDYDLFGGAAPGKKSGEKGEEGTNGEPEKAEVSATKEKEEAAKPEMTVATPTEEGSKDTQGTAKTEEKTDDKKPEEKKSTEEKKETKKDEEKDAKSKSTSATKDGKAPKDDKDKGKSSTSGGNNGKNLWVSGLSSSTRATDLKSLFSKYGKVAGAKVVTNARSPGSRCYGFVIMSTMEEASKCIQHLHRTELHGRMISVERAKTDPASAAAKAMGTSSSSSRRTSSASDRRTDTRSSDRRTDHHRSTHSDSHRRTTSGGAHSTHTRSTTDPKKIESKDKDKEKEKEKEKPKEKDAKAKEGEKDKKEEGEKKDAEKKEDGEKKAENAVATTTTGEKEKVEGAEKKEEKEGEKTGEKKDEKKEGEKGKDDRRSSSARRGGSSRGSRGKSKDTVLSFEKIKEEREKARLRQRERAKREAERRAQADIEYQRKRQRDIAIHQREEAQRLQRERDRIKMERERLEREKVENERAERDRIRLERERREREMREREVEARRLEQLRYDEARRAQKRPYDPRGREEPFWDNKRAAHDRYADYDRERGNRYEERSGDSFERRVERYERREPARTVESRDVRYDERRDAREVVRRDAAPRERDDRYDRFDRGSARDSGRDHRPAAREPEARQARVVSPTRRGSDSRSDWKSERPHPTVPASQDRHETRDRYDAVKDMRKGSSTIYSGNTSSQHAQGSNAVSSKPKPKGRGGPAGPTRDDWGTGGRKDSHASHGQSSGNWQHQSSMSQPSVARQSDRWPSSSSSMNTSTGPRTMNQMNMNPAPLLAQPQSNMYLGVAAQAASMMMNSNALASRPADARFDAYKSMGGGGSMRRY